MHTWAGLTFTNSEGVQISGGMLGKGKDNISRRHIRCAKLRFLFIDEVECLDAGKIYEGEAAAYQGVSEHHSYKRHALEHFKRLLSYRSFAGTNTLFIDDFYQLPLENEYVRNIMFRIWHCVDEMENPNAVQQSTEKKGARLIAEC